MTAPTPEPKPPSMDDIMDAPPLDMGPDHTAVPADLPPLHGVKPPQNSRKNPPRSSDSTKRANNFRDTLAGLGQNKQRASGIRQLTNDDKEKIEKLYVAAAAGLMPFKMDTARALAEQAEACADAWVELSKKNDSVRRVVLWFVETGVWGGLAAAHAPIFMSLMPDDFIPKLFARFQPPQEDAA